MSSPAGPKRGEALNDLGTLAGPAIGILDGLIVAIGTEKKVRRALAGQAPGRKRVPGAPDEGHEPDELDAEGGLVIPGFVDPHTHLVFAGHRAEEFEARIIHRRDYLDFVKSGAGGISTMSRTRATPTSELVSLVRARLERMLRQGTTTAEVKSGYGLSVSEEVRHLEALAAAAADVPIDVAPTLLAAHFRPPEYPHDPEPWIVQIESELLPEVVRRGLATASDVFCEPDIYSVDQARRVLLAAKQQGLALHVHADQLSTSGGAELAVELGALSADHLGRMSEAGVTALAGSSTVAVLIPGSVFFVPGEAVPPVRRMIYAGVAIAIASDCNPGSSPISSQGLAIGLATVLFRISVAEALAAATINAAWAVGVADRVGSLEPGKHADLLVLDADDHRDLAYRFGENLVRHVVKRGQVVVTRPPAGPL